MVYDDARSHCIPIISFQLHDPLHLVVSPTTSLDVSSSSSILLYQVEVEREVERPRLALVLLKRPWTNGGRPKTVVLRVQVQDRHLERLQIVRLLRIIKVVVEVAVGSEAEGLAIHAGIEGKIGVGVADLEPTQLTTVTGFRG